MVALAQQSLLKSPFRVYITIGQAWSNCHIVFAADAACLAISSGVTVRRPCSALSKIPDRSKAS
ncbi:MAG: hypothetical protein M1568_03395 [Acidobacteria bacterium]|nr:hypothetical protein [Acidobacteriota bacterium]